MSKVEKTGHTYVVVRRSDNVVVGVMYYQPNANAAWKAYAGTFFTGKVPDRKCYMVRRDRRRWV